MSSFKFPQPTVYYKVYGAASSHHVGLVTYSLAGWVWFLWSFVHVHALTGVDGFPLHKIVLATDRDILTSFPTRMPFYHWDCLKLTKMAPFQLGVSWRLQELESGLILPGAIFKQNGGSSLSLILYRVLFARSPPPDLWKPHSTHDLRFHLCPT